jgi:hypothetical protein
MTAAAPFSHVTRLEPVSGADSSGPFAGDVHPEWTIGGKANGGYLLAMLGRGVLAAADQPHVLAASAHYLHAPDPGPVQVRVESLRRGRTASQLRAQLVQGDRACVEALFTTGTLERGAEPFWSGGVPSPGDATFDDAVRVPGTSPVGLRIAIMDQVDVRLDRDAAGFSKGRPRGRGELTGWLTLPHGESFDAVSLLYALDSFPPATLDIEATGWVPTLELTGYLRALPAPGPVRVLQKAHLVHSQRVDEQCWVWDSEGQLVAHGTQLAGIRLG